MLRLGIFAFWLVLLLAGSIAAQSDNLRHRFVGSWIAIPEKTYISPQPIFQSKLAPFADALIWTQSTPDEVLIELTRSGVATRSIRPTDGRPDVTTFSDGSRKSSVSKWNKNTFVTKIKTEWPKGKEILVDGRVFEPRNQEILEQYSISKDGNNLVVSVSHKGLMTTEKGVNDHRKSRRYV